MMERARYNGNGMWNNGRRGCGCGTVPARSNTCGLCGNTARRDAREDQIRPRNDGGCGCSCGGHADRPNNALLRELRKVDFSLIDLILYLDMYPDCEESKQRYRCLQAKRNQLLAALAEDGYPISPQSVVGDFSHWTEGPWPWEIGANE